MNVHINAPCGVVKVKEINNHYHCAPDACPQGACLSAPPQERSRQAEAVSPEPLRMNPAIGNARAERVEAASAEAPFVLREENAAEEDADPAPAPMKAAPAGNDKVRELPDVFRTPLARELMEKFVAAGLLTPRDWQPVERSWARSALMADELGHRLGLTCRWKAFEALWHLNRHALRSNLIRAYGQKNTTAFIERMKRALENDRGRREEM